MLFEFYTCMSSRLRTAFDFLKFFFGSATHIIRGSIVALFVLALLCTSIIYFHQLFLSSFPSQGNNCLQRTTAAATKLKEHVSAAK